MSIYYVPFQTALDGNGDPISGAKLTFYASGTTTKQPIYSDSAKTITHTNPVISNASGRFEGIYLSEGVSYKVTLTDSDDVSAGPDIEQVAAEGVTVNVKLLGAIGNGVADDTAAIQSAIDYAGTLTGTFLTDTGIGVFFPHGVYLVTALTMPVSNVSLYSEPGRGAVILSKTNSAHAMIEVGDDTYASQTYHNNISNLTFLADTTIADRTDTTAIELHDCISGRIENCTFNNWNKSIDGYRFNTSTVTRCEFRQHNRTSATHANSAIALNGRSTDGLTSGGNHISNCEILGSSVTADAVYTANMRVDSADGLYVENCHMYKALTNVLFSPSGAMVGNYVEGISFNSCYFDQPTTRCIQFEGSVADLSGSGGIVGKYQNITFDGCYYRGGATTDAGTVFAPYLVGAAVTSVNDSFESVKFTDCRFRQAGIAAIQFSGSSGGKVDCGIVTVSGNTFLDNRQDGVSNYSAFTGEIAALTFSGNTVLGDANSGAYLVQVTIAADEVCLFHGNNCGAADFTAVDPFAITTIQDARIHVSDNLLPDVGRSIDQTYLATTTDATVTNIFTYTVPATSSGFIRAKILGRSLDGTRVLSHEYAGAFRDVGAGAAWVGADPATERSVTVNPSTTAVALQITGQDVEVEVTGLAAETLEWTCHIEMIAQ